MLVYDCMSRSPVTVSPKESLADARHRMTEHEVHQLPVVDAGRYLGLLTERDLSVHETHRADRTVDHAYRPFVEVLAPEMPVADAARILLETRSAALPVVADGRLVGVLSRSDLISLLARGTCSC